VNDKEFLTNLLEQQTNKILNEDQTAAVGKIEYWLNESDEREFVLSGFAGTGKTFCLKHLVAMRSDLRIAYTAPTNKAARVLRDTTGQHAITIYSLLNLRLSATGELKEIIGEEPPDLSKIDLIVIDEGSMVNTLLRKHLNEALMMFPQLRILYLGDPCQLPPVGEYASPIWAVPKQANLTKVMRHDSSILAVCTEVRRKVDAPFGAFKLPRFDDISVLSRAEFQKAMVDNAELFTRPGACRAVAWRNVRVDHFNRLVRGAIFPGVNQQWVAGDRIALLEPAIGLEDEQLAITDDEGVIQNVSHTEVHDIPCWSLRVMLDTNKTVTLWSVHPAGWEVYNDRINRLKAEAKAMPSRWKSYWEFHESFHRVRYGYAITAHKSQGSTYHTVFVDVADILQNRNRREAFQCLYVACSRASGRLILCQSL
jgi:exodeoxyribonuclease-5